MPVVEEVTFRKSVQQAARAASNFVTQRSLGGEPQIKRRFAQSLTTFKPGAARRTASKRKKAWQLVAGDGGAALVAKRRRAMDIFISHHMKEQPQHRSAARKRQIAGAQWVALPHDARAPYEAEAERATERMRERQRVNSNEFCDLDGAGRLPSLERATARKHAVLNTIRQFKEHMAWHSGSGVACFESGLKPELVTDGTDVAVKSECDDRFAFDVEPVSSPKGVMKQEQICGVQFGPNVCGNAALHNHCKVATKNLYTSFKKMNVGGYKKSLPLLIRLELGGVSGLWWVTDVVGQGDVAMMAEAAEAPPRGLGN